MAIQIALRLTPNGNLGDLIAHSVTIEKYLEKGLEEHPPEPPHVDDYAGEPNPLTPE